MSKTHAANVLRTIVARFKKGRQTDARRRKEKKKVCYFLLPDSPLVCGEGGKDR